MTDHVKCPECGIECVAIAWGELWRGGCPEHYLGPPRSDTDLALVEVGRILRPYWRECEAADMAAKAEPPDSPTVKDATPPIRLRVRYGCPSALVVPAPRR